MNELHAKLIDSNQFEPKEGQCDDFACSNNKSITHCPSFGYEYVPSSDNAVDKAFDILFEEVIKINKK